MGTITSTPADLYTSVREGTRRLAVDPQQTSFEENRQFKFYDDCTGADAIANADILIYRVTTAYASKIQLRLIDGILGSRKCTVYINTGGDTITEGTWVDVSADKISPVNNDLSASGHSVHPTSGWTIEKRIATAFSTTAPKNTGTAYKTDSATNRATSSYAASGNAAGWAAGDSFLLVFENIDGNADAEFLFQLEWEESP